MLLKDVWKKHTVRYRTALFPESYYKRASNLLVRTADSPATHPPNLFHHGSSTEVFINGDANARSFRERRALFDERENGNDITTSRKSAASPGRVRRRVIVPQFLTEIRKIASRQDGGGEGVRCRKCTAVSVRTNDKLFGRMPSRRSRDRAKWHYSRDFLLSAFAQRFRNRIRCNIISQCILLPHIKTPLAQSCVARVSQLSLLQIKKIQRCVSSLSSLFLSSSP